MVLFWVWLVHWILLSYTKCREKYKKWQYSVLLLKVNNLHVKPYNQGVLRLLQGNTLGCPINKDFPSLQIFLTLREFSLNMISIFFSPLNTSIMTTPPLQYHSGSKRTCNLRALTELTLWCHLQCTLYMYLASGECPPGSRNQIAQPCACVITSPDCPSSILFLVSLGTRIQHVVQDGAIVRERATKKVH